VEKAIMSSDLGLNPVPQDNIIRVTLPPLTQERRQELGKIVKSKAEDCRVGIRNVRRDTLAKIKDLLKNKEISEDEEHSAQEKIQQITDKFIAEVEKVAQAKEQELMQV